MIDLTLKKNFFWQSSERIVSGIYVLLINSVLAKTLGTNQYGEFVYLLTIIAIAGSISSMGIDILFSNHHIKEGKPSSPDFFTPIAVKSAFASISLALILTISLTDLISETSGTPFLILSITIFASVFSIFESYLQAEERGPTLAKAKLAAICFSLPIKLSAIFYLQNIIAIAVAFVLETLLTSAFLGWAVRRNLRGTIKFDRIFGMKLASDCIPIASSSILVILYMKSDQLMVASMIGKDDLGIYAAATKPVEILSGLAILFTTIAFPRIASKKTASKRDYFESWELFFQILTIFSVALSVCFTLFSPLIFNLLFGEAYKQAIVVSNIYIWSILFVFIGTASTRLLIYEGYQKQALIFKLMGFLANLALNWILIPKLGTKGAALATVFSYFIAVFVSLAIFKETRIILKTQINALYKPRIFHYVKNSL